MLSRPRISPLHSFGLASTTRSQKEKVAILVPSCDAYSDLWQPFFTLLLREWPDCPFETYLGSNQQTASFPNVRMLHSASTTNSRIWSDCVADYLAQIEEKFVLLWLEDFFLKRPVDTPFVKTMVDQFFARDAHMLRLVARPGPSRMLDTQIGVCEVGAPYRVSTQTAIWRKETLSALLKSGESIWEFETNGSRRSSVFSGFYAVRKDVIPYGHHVVERGKWFPWEARRFGRMNIGCDFSRRRIMSPLQSVRWLAHKTASTVWHRIKQFS